MGQHAALDTAMNQQSRTTEHTRGDDRLLRRCRRVQECPPAHMRATEHASVMFFVESNKARSAGAASVPGEVRRREMRTPWFLPFLTKREGGEGGERTGWMERETGRHRAGKGGREEKGQLGR